MTVILNRFYLAHPSVSLEITQLAAFGPCLTRPWLRDGVMYGRVYPPNDMDGDDRRMMAELRIFADGVRWIDAEPTKLYFVPTRAGWKTAWRIARMLACGGFAYLPNRDAGNVLIELCPQHRIEVLR